MAVSSVTCSVGLRALRLSAARLRNDQSAGKTFQFRSRASPGRIMDSDWIWEALALGEESLLKDADIDYFDWNSTHEKYGTPLIALIVGKATGQEVYDFATGTPEKLTERLSLMKLVLSKGASPHSKPPGQFTICKSWWKTEGDKEVENSRTPLVHFNDKCAYGVVASCLEALTNVEGDWKRELRFLRDAAKILASFRPNGNTRSGVAKVEVAESAVETWDSLLSSGDCADLTLACRSNQRAEVVELKAHAPVLRCASKVLRAMLSPAFREGQAARIEVDCEAPAVKILLVLIYTGEDVEAEDYPFDHLLAALELAHQWDVAHPTAALEVAIARALDDEHFAKAADAAVRLQLRHLATCCENFAKNSAEVKKRYKASQYPGQVQVLLVKLFGELDQQHGAADGRRKRRRLASVG